MTSVTNTTLPAAAPRILTDTSKTLVEMRINKLLRDIPINSTTELNTLVSVLTENAHLDPTKADDKKLEAKLAPYQEYCVTLLDDVRLNYRKCSPESNSEYLNAIFTTIFSRVKVFCDDISLMAPVEQDAYVNECLRKQAGLGSPSTPRHLRNKTRIREDNQRLRDLLLNPQRVSFPVSGEASTAIPEIKEPLRSLLLSNRATVKILEEFYNVTLAQINGSSLNTMRILFRGDIKPLFTAPSTTISDDGLLGERSFFTLLLRWGRPLNKIKEIDIVSSDRKLCFDFYFFNKSILEAIQFWYAANLLEKPDFSTANSDLIFGWILDDVYNAYKRLPPESKEIPLDELLKITSKQDRRQVLGQAKVFKFLLDRGMNLSLFANAPESSLEWFIFSLPESYQKLLIIGYDIERIRRTIPECDQKNLIYYAGKIAMAVDEGKLVNGELAIIQSQRAELEILEKASFNSSHYIQLEALGLTPKDLLYCYTTLGSQSPTGLKFYLAPFSINTILPALNILLKSGKITWHSLKVLVPSQLKLVLTNSHHIAALSLHGVTFKNLFDDISTAPDGCENFTQTFIIEHGSKICFLLQAGLSFDEIVELVKSREQRICVLYAFEFLSLVKAGVPVAALLKLESSDKHAILDRYRTVIEVHKDIAASTAFKV